MNLQLILKNAGFLLLFLSTTSFSQTQLPSLQEKCLQVLNPYCEVIKKINKTPQKWSAVLKSGKILECLPAKPLDFENDLDFVQLLASPSLSDMLLQPYSFKSSSSPEQRRNFDPGRIRVQTLFEEIFGNSEAAVKANLVLVNVPPFRMMLNKKIGAAQAMKNVLLELQSKPNLWTWMTNNRKFSGAFTWRPVAGTGRLSMHSFGVAVDFEPKDSKKTTYWRWAAKCKPNTACKNPMTANEEDLLLVPPPNFDVFNTEVVEVFEKHGFIAGAKWYHYDTMHFEFRPEFSSSRITCSALLK